LVHCLAGVGRTGMAVIAYRCIIQKWNIELAIQEAKIFPGSQLFEVQERYIRKWVTDKTNAI
jgi:protein tyrosine phosphatase